MRNRLRTALLVALSVVGIVTMVPAQAESSASSFGSRLVTLINQARADHGLRGLTVTAGTSQVAAAWTQHLASAGALSHNPNLGPQLESHGSPDWTTYGENVGEGPSSSADTLFQAYMNSPEHRDNILGSRYRYLGVGVVFTGSTAWNTLDFVDQYSSSSSTTSSSPSTTTSTRPSSPRVTRPASTATSPQAAPRPATRTTQRSALAQALPPGSVATPARPVAPGRHAAAARPTTRRALAAPAAPSVRAAAPAAVTDAAVVPLPGHDPSQRPMLIALALLALLVTSFTRVVCSRSA